MAPLRSRPGHGLLRCPVCRLELSFAANALVCRNRHSFDFARDGYVNLLQGRRRRHPAEGGGNPAQLRHRAAFLDAGHFDAVAATIAQQMHQADAQSASRQWHVLDAGSGTGHHLAKLAAALPTPSVGLGLDISKQAARHAARRWPMLAFAVADLWSEWPVRDATVDLVASIFAPKNFGEMRRVLRRGGWLAVAYPGSEHMSELIDRFGLIRPHRDMPRHYAQMAGHFIGSPSFVRLWNRVVLDAAMVRAAVLMGPNAHHIVPSALPAGDVRHRRAVRTQTVIDVVVYSGRKRLPVPTRRCCGR